MKLAANFTGIMDRDSDDRFIEEGNYRMLKNGIIDRSEGGGRFLVKNLKSDKLVCQLPSAGNFVGGKEYKGLYYAFYYNEDGNILSLFQVNPVSGSYNQVFSRVLEDVVMEYPGDSGIIGSPPPSPEFNFFNKLLKVSDGSVYSTIPIVSNGDFVQTSGITAGTPIASIEELNDYFRLSGVGTINERLVCRVRIVVNGSLVAGASSAGGVTSKFHDLSDFASIFTIKNKGGADEYLLCSAPLRINGDITALSTANFVDASFVNVGGEGEAGVDPSDPIYTTVTYKPVSEILSIDFVENQASGDIMCYWTDGVNNPFKVNISWLLEGNSYPQVRDMFNIKLVPSEPTVSFYRDYSKSSINTKNANFQFAQRYVYPDGEKTPLSTYSRGVFAPNSLLSESELDSAKVGYYVSEGKLYRFSGFDLGTASQVGPSLDLAYDRVLASYDGSLVLLYASGSEKPVLRSTDYGQTFKEGPSHRFTAYGCMSRDGRYVYMGGVDLWMSSDYGQTFVKLRNIGATGSITTIKLACSDNGDILTVTYGASTIVSQEEYVFSFVALVFGNNGDTLLQTLKSQISSYSAGEFDNYGWGSAVSESGRHIICFLADKMHVSRDFGASFDVQDSFDSKIQSVVIYDSGIGFADGYRTTNFFDTHPAWSGADYLWRYNYAVIAKVGSVYKKYSLEGAELGSVTLPQGSSPAFIDEIDVRTAINRIENIANVVNVFIGKPNPMVDKVEVFAIDTNSGNAYLIDTLKNNNIPDEGAVVNFSNNLVYRALSETEKNVLFSNVPETAKLESLVGGRLFYANYRDGKDFKDVDGNDIDVDFNITPLYGTYDKTEFVATTSGDNVATLVNNFPQNYTIKEGDVFVFSFIYSDTDSIIQTVQFTHVFSASYAGISAAVDELDGVWKTCFPGGEVNEVTNGLSFNTGNPDVKYVNLEYAFIQDMPITYRKGYSMNVGIVYYDDYNRGSYPLFDNNRISISESMDNPKVSLQATITHRPPSWARKYKFVRTDRDLQYFIIPGFQFVKADGEYVYLMKYASDSFLPDPGMYLDVHQDDGRILTLQVSNRVMREADFVEGAPAGEWIVVKAPSAGPFSAQSVSNGTHNYGTGIFYARQSLETQENIVFYEIPGVYYVVNGYHKGNVQDQDNGNPAIVDIVNDGNVFYLGGLNIETNSIGDGKSFFNGGRALLEIENPGSINRYNSLTWSDLFVQDTGSNGLSMFNANLTNFTDLDVDKGAINAIMALDTNLFVWQDDQVGYLLINKNAIVTSDGESAVVQSNQVAGNFIPYSGTYGTIHAKSIAHHGGVRFFVDAKRNAICSIGQEGIMEISDYFMSSEFNQVINTEGDYLGAFNKDHKELWVYSRANATLYVYDIRQKGWTRIVGPIIIQDMFSDDKTVYSLNGREIYAHMKGEDYGKIRGVTEEFVFEYVCNQSPGTIKVYNAVELEANKPVSVDVSIEGDYNSGEVFNTSSISADDYEEREGEYFAYIPPVKNVAIGGGGVITPLGTIDRVEGGRIYMKSPIPTVFGDVNHSIHVMEADGSVSDRALLTAPNQIGPNWVSEVYQTAAADVGKFVFLVENSYINGHRLRGPFARVTFREVGNDKIAIFSNKINVIESKNE